MAVATRKVLQLVFEGADKEKKTLRIPDPRANLTAAEIQVAMNYVVDNSIYGTEAQRAVSARIVETNTQEFDVMDA